MNKRPLLALVGSLALAAGTATAQAPAGSPARIRGTLDAVSQTGLDLTTTAGDKMHVILPETFRVTSVVKSKMADIQPGSYIGSAARTQPDGTLRAVEVSVFPPTMRGVGLGSYPWDLGPNTSMTNGTVGKLEGTNGHTMTVDYGKGEKQIVVADDTPVVTFEAADRNVLQPGAHVIINGQRAANDVVTAGSISVGREGLVPPM